MSAKTIYKIIKHNIITSLVKILPTLIWAIIKNFTVLDNLPSILSTKFVKLLVDNFQGVVRHIIRSNHPFR